MKNNHGGLSVFKKTMLVQLIVCLIISILFYGTMMSKMRITCEPEVNKGSQQRATTYQHPNANDFDPVKTCTPEQLSAIERMLLGHPKWIKSNTSCPDKSWLSKYYIEYFGRNGRDETTREHPSDTTSKAFLGISVGCNKGFDAIETARMGMSNTKFNKSTWREALNVNMGNGGCGQEQDNNDPLLTDIQHNPMKEDEMHCIEPMPATFDVLLNASQTLGLDEEGLVVSKAAISSSNGKVRFPKGYAGAEAVSLHYSVNRPYKPSEEVPMYSLQTYVNTFVKSTGPINILSIDVEGYDFDVLFGAGDVLDRTQYLEFEFHIVGNWLKYSVMDAVNLLDGKGFTCY